MLFNDNFFKFFKFEIPSINEIKLLSKFRNVKLSKFFKFAIQIMSLLDKSIWDAFVNLFILLL